MKPYDLDQNRVEVFAKEEITKVYDDGYKRLKWQEKNDNYDFVSEDGSIALEVTSIISSALKSEKKYEEAYERKGLNALKNHIWASYEVIDAKGIFKRTSITSISEIEKLVCESLKVKNDKMQKRIGKGQSYKNYELCICIYECPFYSDMQSFSNIKRIIDNCIGQFNKVFVITVDCLFVYI